MVISQYGGGEATPKQQELSYESVNTSGKFLWKHASSSQEYINKKNYNVPRKEIFLVWD